MLSGLVFITCTAPYSGNLNVLEPITLMNQADKDIPLKPGTYNVDIRWKKGQAYVEFLLTDNKGSKQTFRFNVLNVNPIHKKHPRVWSVKTTHQVD